MKTILNVQSARVMQARTSGIIIEAELSEIQMYQALEQFLSHVSDDTWAKWQRDINAEIYGQTGHGTVWTAQSTLGESDTPVACHFNTDEDGNPTDTKVLFAGVDVMPIMSLAQIDQIDRDCARALPAQLVDWNTEMMISRAQERAECEA